MTVRDPGGASRLVPCVGAVVNDAAGRLLLVRRAHPPGAGLWSLPGGRVEDGESDEAAVAREVAEETGLEVTVGARVGSVRREAPDGRVFDIRDHRASPAGAASSPDGPSPPLRPGDDAADARWVDAADCAAMDAAGELVPGLTETLDGWGVLPRCG